MATTVLLLDEQTIQQLGEIYQDAIHQIPPHAHYQLKLPSLTVTAYHSGKVVLQGTNVDAFVQKHDLTASTSTKKSKVETNGLPEGFSNWSVIGSDEVGTGSYFGPLTVACAFVPENLIKELQILGVKDSKNLTDAQIQEIVPKIKALIPYKLHIAVAAASMIARDAFLEGLKTLSKEYGYPLLSGANAAVDELASKILKQDGMEGLRKVAKLHFANTQKAIDLAK